MTKYLHHHFSRHPNVNTNTLKWTNMKWQEFWHTHPPPPSPKKENAHYNMEKSAPYHQGKYLLTRTNSDNAQIHKTLLKKGLPSVGRVSASLSIASGSGKMTIPSVTGGLVVVGRAGNCSDKANLPYKEVKSNRPLLMSSSFWSLSVAVLLQLRW